MYVNRKYYAEEGYEYLEEDFGIKELAISDFELIEDQTIDIDSIEELDKCDFGHNNTISQQEVWYIDKINEVIKGLKHLNKEIQSIKEK